MNKTSLEFNLFINGVKFKIFINENFAFTENSTLSVPHDHYDFELHYLKSGSYNEIINDKAHKINESELFIIKPYQIHYRSRLENSKFYDYNFRFLPIKPSETAKDFVKKEYNQIINLFNNFQTISLNDNFIKFFEGVEKEILNSKFGFVDAVKSYIQLILLEILRVGNSDKKETAYEFLGYSRNKIDEFFSQKYLTNVKINDLANDMNLSVRQVNRIMIKYFGVSFKTRLTEMRLLEIALRLKTTNDSALTISRDCGFNNYNNFYTVFIKKFKVTPTKYRALHKK